MRLPAIAAVVLIAAFDVGCSRKSSPPDLREELSQATQQLTYRAVRGKLSGDFRYAPVDIARGTSQRNAPPELWTAVAKLRRAAQQSGSAQLQAALGVAWLQVGETTQGLATLEAAAAAAPEDANIHNDLAVAYIERASNGGPEQDWARALSEADRALRLQRSQGDAQFNRALILESLHLRSEALEAFGVLNAMAPGWHDEVSAHVSNLQAAPTLEEDNQDRRERLEDQLLPQWGQAVVRADREGGSRLLDEASAVASRLAAARGDRMAIDAVAEIHSLAARGSASRIRTLAQAFSAFGMARESFLHDNQQRAAELMDKAAALFREAGSPYAHWAPLYRSLYLRNRGDVDGAIRVLDLVPARLIPPGHVHLRARIDWARGVATNSQGRFDAGRVHLARAVSGYQEIGETDNLGATQTLLAECDWVLGNRQAAWTQIVSVLRTFDGRGGTRRDYHFSVAAFLAGADGLHDAALEFHQARLKRARTARVKSAALLYRAEVLTELDDSQAARRDLAASATEARRVEDPVLRDRMLNDIRIAEAQLQWRSEPKGAIGSASESIEYVEESNPALRLAPLLTLRARAYANLGDTTAARTDLLHALQVSQTKRATLSSPQDRVQSFEQERLAYKDLIRLAVVQGGDSAAGLTLVEQARSGHRLSESFSQRIGSDLPPQVAMIVYEVLDDRVLGWTVTRDRISHFASPVSLVVLRSTVNRLDRRIREGASLANVSAEVRELSDLILKPALASIGPSTTVFFVPEGILNQVPFAVLPDASGQPLVMSKTIGLADYVERFGQSSRALANFSASSVVAFGDGSDAADIGFARLPNADREATVVTNLYPQRSIYTGSVATKRRFLEAAGSVLHFSGHTVVNREFPLLSRLLFAPAAADPGSGSLLSMDIARHKFRNTKVVVLASCEGAEGTSIVGAGPLSVANAFLSAGVPAVVASLWPVDDAASQDFFVPFHQALRSTADPATALRLAQLAVLKTGGANLPLKSWAGMTVTGGQKAVNHLKGEAH